MERIGETIKEGNIDEYMSVAKELLAEYDPAEVTAAALKLMTKEPDKTPVHISEERPLPHKKTIADGASLQGPTKGLTIREESREEQQQTANHFNQTKAGPKNRASSALRAGRFVSGCDSLQVKMPVWQKLPAPH